MLRTRSKKKKENTHRKMNKRPSAEMIEEHIVQRDFNGTHYNTLHELWIITIAVLYPYTHTHTPNNYYVSFLAEIYDFRYEIQSPHSP